MNITRHEIFNSISLKIPFSSFCNFNCEYCSNRHDEKSVAFMEDFRAVPFSSGSKTSEEMLEVLSALYSAGFRRIRPTGGEPLIRNDWFPFIEKTHEIGYQDIELTTNGQLLRKEINKNRKTLPSGLSLVKVSLDTLDPFEFNNLSGGKGDLIEVIAGIDMAVELGISVRLNTITLRDGFTPEWLEQILSFCASHRIGAVQFLDLIHFPNLPKPLEKGEMWKKQYVGFEEFRKVFAQVFPDVNFAKVNSYGADFWKTVIFKDGKNITVVFSDSLETMRDEKCEICSDYCQKGRSFIRLGTDGNLTPCPDYQAVLPDHFNVLESLRNGSLNEKLENVAGLFSSATKKRTLERFKNLHHLN